MRITLKGLNSACNYTGLALRSPSLTADTIKQQQEYLCLFHINNFIQFKDLKFSSQLTKNTQLIHIYTNNNNK